MGFEFFVAQRYLNAKRKGLFSIITTIIGIAGVAVGVAAIITTLSVMNGFQSDIQKKIIGAQSHIAVFGQMSRANYEIYKSKIETDQDVKAVAPIIYGQAILSYRERSMGIALKGLNPDDEKKVNTLMSSITNGGWVAPEKPGEKTTPPPLVLGEELAVNLNIFVGDDVVLISPKSIATDLGIFPKMKKFRVSGLLKTGYYDFDNTMAYANIEDASDFLGLEGEITGMEIKLSDINKAQDKAKDIKEIVGFPKVVKTFAQMNQTLFAALKLEKFVMGLILTLIVLVAALNIASNLILLGTEKLRDIGILRAMGATPGSIRSIFLWEGMLIGTIGIGCGLVLGLALCWFIATYPIIELPSEIYYLTKVPVNVQMYDIFITIGCSYLLCLLATIYPAVRSSKISPVDAIRYG